MVPSASTQGQHTAEEASNDYATAYVRRNSTEKNCTLRHPLVTFSGALDIVVLALSIQGASRLGGFRLPICWLLFLWKGKRKLVHTLLEMLLAALFTIKMPRWKQFKRTDISKSWVSRGVWRYSGTSLSMTRRLIQTSAWMNFRMSFCSWETSKEQIDDAWFQS